MYFIHNLLMAGQVLMAFILGAVIGWEREQAGQFAGIRTFAAIAAGSCLFGIVSDHSIGVYDSTRIAAQVVSGIGFLGAGLIFRQGQSVSGLTTAASLWVAAAVGLAVAYQLYFIGIWTTAIMFLLLWLPRMSWWQFISPKRSKKNRITNQKPVE